MAWVRFPAVATSDLQASPLQIEDHLPIHRCSLQGGFVAAEQNVLEGDQLVVAAAVACVVALEEGGDGLRVPI